jgi:hypothetical protein
MMPHFSHRLHPMPELASPELAWRDTMQYARTREDKNCKIVFCSCNVDGFSYVYMEHNEPIISCTAAWFPWAVHGSLPAGEGTARSLRVQVVRHGAAWHTLDADFLLSYLGKVIGHLQAQPHFGAGTKRLR